MSYVIQDHDAGQQLIKDLFGPRVRSLLNTAVGKGYELAIQTKENTNYLNYNKGRGNDILPHLKNYSVEFSIIKYIENGLLPYDFEIKYNSKRTARYFVLFDAHRKIELCVNQVNRKEKIGRPAYYRKQRIESFNSYFTFSENDNTKVITDKPIYFELNHGYQSITPDFVVLGIPSKQGKWLDKVEISREINHIPLNGGIKTTIEEVKDFNFEELQEYIEESERNG
ncbi:hypothetical protein [Metabacillus litoralis]|uniref:hypothetical protein n=1 Tax=Metabacillus litoralis TaxID=152268 RepID=UPI00203BC00C|nr:hypothetical protein [Metabacillus litoralis]MCM3651345.1 hypothetical protein [Metabacillus litoralis]